MLSLFSGFEPVCRSRGVQGIEGCACGVWFPLVSKGRVGVVAEMGPEGEREVLGSRRSVLSSRHEVLISGDAALISGARASRVVLSGCRDTG